VIFLTVQLFGRDITHHTISYYLPSDETMKSSLTYQVLLHLGSYFFSLYCLVIFLLMIYKSLVLPYPSAYFALEFSILVFLALVEALRIVNGWKANLTEDTTFMAISILLFIPGMLGIIYFLLWQTYVLRIEMIFCGVQLTIQGLQLLFSMICIISFYGGTF